MPIRTPVPRLRVALKVGTRKWEMGNEEMRKWEESTLHFTQQTADILLLHAVINVMRKFMSIQHLLRGSSIPYSLHQRGIQQH